jgi:hypothetical protein
MFSAWYFGAGPAILLAGIFVTLQYLLTARTRTANTRHDIFVCFLRILLASTAIIITAEKRRLQNQVLWKEQAELEKARKRTYRGTRRRQPQPARSLGAFAPDAG